jgi:hypothetical protein
MTTTVVQAFDHQHLVFTELLNEVVKPSPDKKQTRVDYTQLHLKSELLSRYLKVLTAVKEDEYDSWTDEQQLSFLINAYNAFTLELIDQNFEKFKADKSLTVQELVVFQKNQAESIKDLGSFFSTPWDKKFFHLLGEKRNLNDLEHDMIREWFERPRIHAALVCAAVSCPPLRNESFIADKLDQQLDDQMRLFLSDDKRNTINMNKNTVYLSSIFKWYDEDFEQGLQGFDSLEDLIEVYQTDIANTPKQLAWLKKQDYRIRYLDYDWRLNDVSNFD